MHFSCRCGYCFHDNTDCLPFKGRIIADQDWNDLWSLIENGIRNGENLHSVCDSISELFQREMYQCPECGRLYIDDDNGRTFTAFSPNGEAEPEPDVDRRMLESVHGKSWRGFLYADWYDNPPVWIRHKGTIIPELNDKFDKLEFDDYDEFRARFFALYTEMREDDNIRSAMLRINGKREFSWFRGQ